MKRVPRTNSWYPLRRRGGREGNREHSVPATATASKARHPSQLLPEQKQILVVEFRYCEDTRARISLRPPSSNVISVTIF
eukprot:1148070-Pelagomonas_calceolata.AAC.1